MIQKKSEVNKHNIHCLQSRYLWECHIKAYWHESKSAQKKKTIHDANLSSLWKNIYLNKKIKKADDASSGHMTQSLLVGEF